MMRAGCRKNEEIMSQAGRAVDFSLTRKSVVSIKKGASGNNSVVECNLAKVEVAGSNPVSRSIFFPHKGGIAKW
jgi:hypothetical protein